MTPHEVFAIRDNTEPDRAGWYVRVVPNKFPALDIEGDLNPREDGVLHAVNGIGAHEIVIEHPKHDALLPFLGDDQIMRVIEACCSRVEDLRRDVRFRHVIVFRNHGTQAGASVSHPHSQVMALPIIPRAVRELLGGAGAHHARTGRCVFCDLVAQELAAGQRVVLESPHFMVLAPYASRFAFETSITPRRHCADMTQMGTEERADLAGVLRRLLTAYRSALTDPPYNLVYQTGPSPGPGPDGTIDAEALAQQFHWHIEVMPRLTTLAGFEWGTGFYMNPVAPEEAARVLREALP
jgi:UDPglucose--hexose-1-phosphate uridylyltransferase